MTREVGVQQHQTHHINATAAGIAAIAAAADAKVAVVCADSLRRYQTDTAWLMAVGLSIGLLSPAAADNCASGSTAGRKG
jgi:hypothetical protein